MQCFTVCPQVSFYFEAIRGTFCCMLTACYIMLHNRLLQAAWPEWWLFSNLAGKFRFQDILLTLITTTDDVSLSSSLHISEAVLWKAAVGRIQAVNVCNRANVKVSKLEYLWSWRTYSIFADNSLASPALKTNFVQNMYYVKMSSDYRQHRQTQIFNQERLRRILMGTYCEAEYKALSISTCSWKSLRCLPILFFSLQTFLSKN